MTTRIVSLTSLAILSFLTPGCISHQSTVYRDVERASVEFESDAAARLFYETYTKQYAGRKRPESTTEVGLPIVFSHERKVVTGPNFSFNEAVDICDANNDGRITEQEARVFANQR